MTPGEVADVQADYAAVVAKLTVEREYRDTLRALRARVEALEAALHGIANCCDVYPSSVFPQSSADAALASCKDAGIPTDAMHGTWARHLLGGIGRDARAALEVQP